MKKWAVAALAVTLMGCEEPVDIDYTITKDEKNGNTKRSVEVELPERIERDSLRALAEEIHEGGYDRTFIGYRIEGEEAGPYWATTHYNPDMDVVILGSTVTENARLDQKSDGINGEVIGEWRSTWVSEYKIVFLSRDGEMFVKRDFADGSGGEERLFRETRDGKTVYYDESSEQHGEYYVISQDGRLQFWSENGNYYTAPKDG